MNLFETIATLHPKLDGWCDLEKAMTLASIVVGLRPQVSVEIGVYGGKSFLPIALAHQAIKTGMAIGIDPWSVEVAVREYHGQPQHQDWWSKLDIGKVERGFLRALNQVDPKYTDIIKNESKNVPPPNAIGLLHVDGAHSETAIADVLRFAPKVQSGGFVVMDDLDGSHGSGPAMGEQRLVSMGFRKLYNLGTGAVFQR